MKSFVTASFKGKTLAQVRKLADEIIEELHDSSKTGDEYVSKTRVSVVPDSIWRGNHEICVTAVIGHEDVLSTDEIITGLLMSKGGNLLVKSGREL